uniref:Transposase n=1 Tax=Streptomyces sp. NBC_00003 TaxID=2903608 RepID=A0AAU2UZ41_9ACTN
MPAPDEPRQSLWVAEDVWKKADPRANADGLPIARTLALLAAA